MKEYKIELPPEVVAKNSLYRSERRERIATAAMQANLTRNDLTKDFENIARLSVMHADALIKELDK